MPSLLAAEKRRTVLCVFQGMDAPGKDGSIKALMHHLNPMIVHQKGFGTPTRPELAHDFLGRVHRETPGRVEIGMFHRSHYEDVLIVRVDSLVPKGVGKPRTYSSTGSMTC